MEIDVKAKEALWGAKLCLVGNLVHDSVPISDNEVLIMTMDLTQHIMDIWKEARLDYGHAAVPQ